MELLRDPIWQFIGAILALIAIAISILVFKLQRKRKRLSYNIVIDTPLLSVREDIEGKLKITYQRKRVKNIRLVEINFSNTGNVPITTSDYERPLKVCYGDAASILTAEISNVEPSNLCATITSDTNSYTISPVLLNPKDSISVRVLLSDYDRNFTIDTRIIGIFKVQPVDEFSITSSILILLGLFFTLLGLGGITSMADNKNSPLLIWKIGFAIGSYLVGVFIFSFGLRRNRRWSKKIYKFLQSVLRILVPI
jgi:hypothetical protein